MYVCVIVTAQFLFLYFSATLVALLKVKMYMGNCIFIEINSDSGI